MSVCSMCRNYLGSESNLEYCEGSSKSCREFLASLDHSIKKNELTEFLEQQGYKQSQGPARRMLSERLDKLTEINSEIALDVCLHYTKGPITFFKDDISPKDWCEILNTYTYKGKKIIKWLLDKHPSRYVETMSLLLRHNLQPSIDRSDIDEIQRISSLMPQQVLRFWEVLASTEIYTVGDTEITDYCSRFLRQDNLNAGNFLYDLIFSENGIGILKPENWMNAKSPSNPMHSLRNAVEAKFIELIRSQSINKIWNKLTTSPVTRHFVSERITSELENLYLNPMNVSSNALAAIEIINRFGTDLKTIDMFEEYRRRPHISSIMGYLITFTPEQHFAIILRNHLASKDCEFRKLLVQVFCLNYDFCLCKLQEEITTYVADSHFDLLFLLEYYVSLIRSKHGEWYKDNVQREKDLQFLENLMGESQNKSVLRKLSKAIEYTRKSDYRCFDFLQTKDLGKTGWGPI
jgi:hypothetical protein